MPCAEVSAHLKSHSSERAKGPTRAPELQGPSLSSSLQKSPQGRDIPLHLPQPVSPNHTLVLDPGNPCPMGLSPLTGPVKVRPLGLLRADLMAGGKRCRIKRRTPRYT